MRAKTFKGGIHPKEHKELSNKCAITPAFPVSKTVTIPVTMGGAPNTPVVKVGDVVVKGQVIATGDKFMNCPVHASVSGKVTKIQNCLVTGNSYVPCIVIQSDDSEAQEFLPVLDPFACSKEDALARIKDAGIVGMGGASFPAHVKLNPPADKVIDYVLVNAAECEPYLTCDERTMIETPNLLIDGLAIVLKIVNEKALGIIALEDNKEYILPILEEEIKKQNLADKISVCLVQTKYPQGSEKFIVKSCVDREIPSGKLPADAGCVICNVGTVCAISEAFRLGKPLIERALTISGGGVKNPCNLRVPVGTLISDLTPAYFEINENVAAVETSSENNSESASEGEAKVSVNGGDCVAAEVKEPVKVISGGPMMGFSMAAINFPVAKGTSGVTFLTDSEAYLTEESQCISCGYCARACAMRLSPVLILRELKAGNTQKAIRYGLMDCIECGCCAFMCPAHIRIVQKVRLGKAIVRTKMAEEKAKEAAKKS